MKTSMAPTAITGLSLNRSNDVLSNWTIDLDFYYIHTTSYQTRKIVPQLPHHSSLHPYRPPRHA